MVAVAKGASGRRKTGSYQTENATVMLEPAKDLVKAAVAEIADAGQGFDGDRAVPMRPDILGGTVGLPPRGGLRFVAQIAESST